MIAGKRPGHPIKQYLVNVASSGKLLPKNAKDTLDRPLDGGVASIHPLLERRGRLIAFDPGIEGYKSTSAFKQGMDAGYTALERAIEGILGILGEELPTGRDVHKVLLDRVTRPLTGDHARPAIFDERLKKNLLETLRMRYRVRHSSYDEFIPHLAEPSVDAARNIVARIRDAINEFKKKIDPESADDND